MKLFLIAMLLFFLMGANASTFLDDPASGWIAAGVLVLGLAGSIELIYHKLKLTPRIRDRASIYGLGALSIAIGIGSRRLGESLFVEADWFLFLLRASLVLSAIWLVMVINREKPL